MIKTHPMWDNYPDIQYFLRQCLERIKEKTTIENNEIKQTILDLIESQGKLLRPAYFYLFSQLGNASSDEHPKLISAAASTEVLHLATLIHDDIIDESKMRRGLETVQSKHGKDVAVYTGDLLLSVYFDLLADATDSMEIIKLNTLSMKRVLLGEINQMTNTYNTKATYDDYLRSIKGKTAQLFELSCYEGAYFGQGASEVIEKSRFIGQSIGIAFQMLDDILDYTQTSKTLAKPVLNDVKQGIYTLPIILGIETSVDFLPLLEKKENLSKNDLATLLSLLEEHHCIERARDIAKKYIDQALVSIKTLPAQPERDMLYELTHQLLTREA